MNALQTQHCIDNALRCQTTTRLILAPLITAAVRTHIPSSNLNLQRRSLHRKATRITSAPTCRRPSSRLPIIHPFPRLDPIIHTASYSTALPSNEPTIHPVFEHKSGTFQYLVADPSTKKAAIIDPVLDYDKCSQTITTTTADALLSLVREKGYTISLILETHAHADHLTSSFYLQRRLTEQQGTKPPVCIGKRIGQVQMLFGERYGIDADEYEGVFDKLFEDDEEFRIGELTAKAIHLPGHTPDHLGYKIGDNVFCGDSLFHVDIGTARCDFPGGSAHSLYKSARKLLSLPDHVKVWTGHDYPPEGERDPVPYVTVGGHRQMNRHVKDGMTEDEFVAMRNERDSHLAAPRLLHESLQVNVRAGRLPKENEAGMRLLKVPVKVKGMGL
ncbi:putative beta-lactamase hydrolase-like protein [Cladorrhinum sp. PSN259]|nr:putative beta-lactamase hydrolase-like protein [Cladorrhinum sp. PSN259]